MEVLFSSNERQSGYVSFSLDSPKIDVIVFADRCIWIGRSAREGFSATGFETLLHARISTIVSGQPTPRRYWRTANARSSTSKRPHPQQ